MCLFFIIVFMRMFALAVRRQRRAEIDDHTIETETTSFPGGPTETVELSDMEKAVRSLHTAFGLDSGSAYSAPLPERK